MAIVKDVGVARAKKSLGIDAGNKNLFKCAELPGGFVIKAKTSKASSLLTIAHAQTIRRTAK